MLKNNCVSGIVEAGCDEAGRGCLAGPVFAAAVILAEDFSNPLLNDSKQLSPRVRNMLRVIIERNAVAWAVSRVDNNTIDEVNILRASIMAMHQALDKLKVTPQHIIVDGNRFYPYRNITYNCMVKGDSTYASIAAASILAKTWRDDYMNVIHEEYEMYGWNSNKGYPTVYHRNAISKFGISPYHRKSFALFNNQLLLNL